MTDLGLGLASSTLPETSPADEKEGQREMADMGLGLASPTLPETAPAEVEQAQAERLEDWSQHHCGCIDQCTYH